MNPSRLIVLAGLVGALYAPVASAKFIEDIIPDDGYQNIFVDPTSTGSTAMPMSLVFDTKMTRASFTAMVVEHLYTDEQIANCYWDIATSLPPTFTLLYTDVHTDSRYGNQLCVALRDGIARGYKDGSFHPDVEITFAEASKIIARAYGLTPYAEATNRGVWYGPYVFALAERNAIPTTVTSLQNIVTAGVTVEIMDRLDHNITTRTSTKYKDLETRVVPLSVILQMNKPTKVMVLPPKTTTPTAGSASSSSSMDRSSQSSSALPWYKLF